MKNTRNGTNGNPIPRSVANDTSTSYGADDFTLHSNLSDDCEGGGCPLTKYIEYVVPFSRQEEVLKHVVESPYYEVGDIPTGFRPFWAIDANIFPSPCSR